MPRKTEEVVVDGTRYRIQQLGATTGSQVMFRLGRAFGAIVVGLRTGSVSVAGLDPADFDWLVQTFIPTTAVGVVDTAGNGALKWVSLAQVGFDDHFAGRYPQLIEWLKASLEVNFGPLQDAVGGLFRSAQSLNGSVSKPPTASTGAAGGSSSAPG